MPKAKPARPATRAKPPVGLTLGQFLTIRKGQPYQAALAGETGPYLLGMGVFSPDGGFRPHKMRRYRGPVRPEAAVAPGAVVVATTDMGAKIKILGRCARVPAWIGDLAVVSGDLGLVDWRTDDVEARSYAYWVMRTEAFRQYCLRFARGTAVRRVSGKDVESFRISDPKDAATRLLVTALESIDEALELNERTSATLEATVRATFKSWFVDFDPVGPRQGHGTGLLPSSAVNLFPESFQNSALGKIPKGWGVGSFADTVDILGGGTPKTTVQEYWGGDLPWFALTDAPSDSAVWVVDTEKHITSEGLSHSSASVLPVGTTIISARGTVGRVALVGVPMAMNQSCYGLRGKVGTNGIYTFYVTRELVARLQRHAHGSVFDTINRQTFAGLPVAVPPSRLVRAFEDYVGPSIERIRLGLLRARSLSALRDTMLPRLILRELPAHDSAGAGVGTGQ